MCADDKFGCIGVKHVANRKNLMENLVNDANRRSDACYTATSAVMCVQQLY